MYTENSLLKTFFLMQGKGMAEGTLGTIATLIGGLAGVAVLAWLASSV